MIETRDGRRQQRKCNNDSVCSTLFAARGIAHLPPIELDGLLETHLIQVDQIALDLQPILEIALQLFAKRVQIALLARRQRTARHEWRRLDRGTATASRCGGRRGRRGRGMCGSGGGGGGRFGGARSAATGQRVPTRAAAGLGRRRVERNDRHVAGSQRETGGLLQLTAQHLHLVAQLIDDLLIIGDVILDRVHIPRDFGLHKEEGNTKIAKL